MFSPERYRAATEGAAVLDRRTRGLVQLTGSDRRVYLQGLLTNDIAALTAGTGCYAALLTPQGRMISDMRVFELGDRLLLDVPGASAARVATHLSDFVFSEDVTVEDVSSTLSHLVVLGSASDKALRIGRLQPFENRLARVGDLEVTVAGNDEFGVTAVDLFVEASRKSSLLAALEQSGVTPVDEDIAEILRIEAGTPRFGPDHDMDEDTIPLEAGIEDRAISEAKGCYVGQEVIIRVLHRGHGRVARKLVGLVFPADGRVPSKGDRLHAGERQVGAVTSAAWSPALARPVALGYVHRDFTAPGTALEAGDTVRQAATVTRLPFAATAAR